MSEELTPVEEEFLMLIERECEEHGLAVGVFNVGVVMGGMAYNVAWTAFQSLREKRLIKAHKLTTKRGQPWGIESETI